MDFRQTRLSLDRPLGTYDKVQRAYSRLVRSRRIQLRGLRENRAELLNVGCGPNVSEGFINLDYQWRPGVALCWDITRGIPLDSSTLRGIYTEHCLEHIPFEACQEAFADFFRLLRPGGVVRIVLPDAELYLDLYARGKRGEEARFPWVTDEDLANGLTPMMAVNGVFRGHGHQYAYDHGTVASMLEKVGFSRIEKERFRHGRLPELLIDTPEREIESLYVEAQKPD